MSCFRLFPRVDMMMRTSQVYSCVLSLVSISLEALQQLEHLENFSRRLLVYIWCSVAPRQSAKSYITSVLIALPSLTSVISLFQLCMADLMHENSL